MAVGVDAGDKAEVAVGAVEGLTNRNGRRTRRANPAWDDPRKPAEEGEADADEEEGDGAAGVGVAAMRAGPAVTRGCQPAAEGEEAAAGIATRVIASPNPPG